MVGSAVAVPCGSAQFRFGLWALGLLPLLLAAASLVARYRRSAGEERLQLKWFAYAAIVTLAVIFPLAPVAAYDNLGQLAFDVAVVAGVGLALPLPSASPS